MLNDYMKKFALGMDARSNRGILARGKNVYRGGSNSPKPLDLRKAALKRLQK
jgi:hypothetical protein